MATQTWIQIDPIYNEGTAQHSKGPIVCGNTQGESFGAINIVVWNLDFPTSLFSTPI